MLRQQSARLQQLEETERQVRAQWAEFEKLAQARDMFEALNATTALSSDAEDLLSVANETERSLPADFAVAMDTLNQLNDSHLALIHNATAAYYQASGAQAPLRGPWNDTAYLKAKVQAGFYTPKFRFQRRLYSYSKEACTSFYNGNFFAMFNHPSLCQEPVLVGFLWMLFYSSLWVFVVVVIQIINCQRRQQNAALEKANLVAAETVPLLPLEPTPAAGTRRKHIHYL